MQFVLAAVLVVVLVLPSGQGAIIGCSPVQPADCAQCTLNAGNIGYLASCSDDEEFYRCTKLDDGTFSLDQMSCPLCTKWSQLELTCVWDLDDQCAITSGATGTGALYVSGNTCYTANGQYSSFPGDSTKFYQNSNGIDQEMTCAPGTVFNLTQCVCVHGSNSPLTQAPDPEMCITFESMTDGSKWGFTDQGLWVGNHDANNDANWQSKHVQMSTNNCKVGNKCGYFDGQSFLTIDSLTNAFHNWHTFAITFWYKPDNVGTMGLLTNGLPNRCSSLPTVSMTKYSNRVSGSVYAGTTGVASLTGNSGSVYAGTTGVTSPTGSGQQATVWTQVTLTKDQTSVTLYVNGNQVSGTSIQGALRASQCPMMIGLDKNAAYFKGYMDQICLYKTAFVPNQNGPN